MNKQLLHLQGTSRITKIKKKIKAWMNSNNYQQAIIFRVLRKQKSVIFKNQNVKRIFFRKEEEPIKNQILVDLPFIITFIMFHQVNQD